MRHFTILLFFLSFIARGQDTTVTNKKLSYGAGGFVTIATATHINDGKSPYGIGASIFGTYRLNKRFIQGKLGYKRYVYGNVRNSILMEDIHTLIAVKQTLNQAKGIHLIAGYIPSFILNAEDRFRGNKDSIPVISFEKDLKNRLTHGIYFGLDLQSKMNGTIDFGYTISLNQGRINGYFDAIPNHFTIGYKFKFNTQTNVPDDVFEVRTSLNALTMDTLYFINKGCNRDFTQSQLDSLLAKNYSFSAYRLLRDEDIQKISNQGNVVHFAIIGIHYSGLSEPETNGIYLLDKDLKNTEYPYPYHTSNPLKGNSLSKCLGGLEKTADLIRTFDGRLYKRYAEIKD